VTPEELPENPTKNRLIAGASVDMTVTMATTTLSLRPDLGFRHILADFKTKGADPNMT